jgi:alkylation response protein AidB-like acyl-CoA dehydrogenase
MTTTTSTRRGGSWLVDPSETIDLFTPERLSDEHRLIARTADEFVTNEVLPNLDQLEEKDWKLARRLVQRAGELGLLGVDAPEAYGGVALDKAASLVVSDHIARSASFGAAYGGQVNLAILPICLFGTEEQKERYLPKLVTGELIGAYALSESGSGSDALGAKTRAIRQPDGSFALTGEKMWITNGGFADVFIVFAKVDGEHFTAFIVERAFAGVSNGKEEHKMGLHGSSTTPIILQEAKVPAANVLGEIGKGHKVAFNVLNFGRFKLGAMCAGGAKVAIGQAALYAAGRRQIGQPIASFGAIKHKLGEMVTRTYAIESLVYRTAGMIDQWIGRSTSGSHESTVLAALEEFAIEASIAKVGGSEALDYVLDENIQIHGGNGFVRDYPAERQYRDSRVNRIFEGTNEINRLLIPGMLVRRALKGDLPIIAAARQLQDEILSGPGALDSGSDALLDRERRAIASFKKIALMVLGTAMQTYGEKLTDQQEVLTSAADILIDTYASESALLRAVAAAEQAVPGAALQADAATVYVNDAAGRIELTARNGLAAMADGDMLRTLLAALRRVLKVTPVNTVALRRKLADEATARGSYPFNG